MADREALLAALKKARARMLDEDGKPRLEGWTRTILYWFPDVDEYWTMEVVDGYPQPPVQGACDDPDIQITMSTDTFVGLMDRTINGMMAVATGKVKVRASMGDTRKMGVFM